MSNRENTNGNGGQPNRRMVSYPAPHNSSPAARRRASQENPQQPSARQNSQQSVWDQAQQQRQQSSRLNAERKALREQRSEQRSGQRSTQRSSTRTSANPSNPRLQSFVREGGQEQRRSRSSRPSAASAQRSSQTSANRSSERPSTQERQRSTTSRNRSEQGIVVRKSANLDNSKKHPSSNRAGGLVGAILKVALAAVVVVGVLCAGGLGIYTAMTPASFNIKVNNQLKTVDRFTSINSLIEDGIANPIPGDHLAVDGSVLVQGGGIQYHATVNGEEPRFTFIPLSSGDVVEIRDGDDTNEEYTSTEKAIEPEKVEDGFGAIHVYVPGTDGVAEVRTGKESGLTAEVVITPAKQATFYKYNADTGSDKVIALTFDDGPWEGTTDDVLDILDRYGVKATFFTIGDQIDEHKDSILRMQSAGHQICTHSWSHASGSGQGVNLTFMTAEEQVSEITKGLEAIKAVTGAEASTVFRAPGGNYTGDIVWTLEEHLTSEIGWNVDTEDWRLPGAEVIADRIMSAEAGDIVLMHDGGGDRTQTVAALEIAIPYLLEQGYTFVTMDELLAYNRAVDMMAQ